MKNLFTVSLLLVTLLAFSQKNEAVKDKNLPEGNKAFEAKNYAGAEEEYRISGSNAPGVVKSSYNLGNAIYKQKKPAESIVAYANAVKNAKTKDEKHKIFHNLGNAFMEMKNYQDAVEAYKNALRNNPADDETRYNYALAKDMLKKNPPKQQPPPPKDDKKDNKGGGGDKDQKPNQKNDKDKGDNKDKKDKGDSKDKNDQNKDKGDQKDKDKGDGKDKKDQGQPEPKGGSPDTDRMERMLNAINNQEKNVQDKINARKVQGQKRPTEKDW
jgi:tetratricopeptide (TPR) repeat protein